MQEKLSIIDSKRVGKRNTLPTKNAVNDPYDSRLCSICFFGYLAYWTICLFLAFCGLASLPFRPQWSRSLQYVYASLCSFHAFGQCCMFLKSLLITFALFPHCSLSSKILPVFSKNYFLNRYKFLIRALSPLLNGTLHHWYIVSALKIIIYNNIICFCLQTLEMYVTLNIIWFLYED